MKSIKALVIIATLMLIYGCKDSTTNSQASQNYDMKLTFNGANYNHQTFNMNALIGYATYDTLNHHALIKFIGNSIPGEIEITLAERYSGTYMWNVGSRVNISMESYPPVSQSNQWHSISVEDGATHIVSFGNIGDDVRGMFDGKFVNDQHPQLDTISISGYFTVTRTN